MVYQEKNLFTKYLKHQIDRDKLIKRLKIVKQANPSSICDSILKKLKKKIKSITPLIAVFGTTFLITITLLKSFQIFMGISILI
tara:strand:+ start:68 stop:319 length:252 start_codon:yes stop_codon:yes gene_type:complete